MFNGLIREIAQVVSFKTNLLCLKANYKPKIGDSIAVNGACLSVVKLVNDTFFLELSKETQNHLALENFTNQVHIEPAITLNTLIDGHLMQGHIDAIGSITDIQKNSFGTDFFIKLPTNVMHLVANKGAIAIDGVSLTINEVFKDSIRLTIIPITLKDTLFKNYNVGRRVNVETDILARYVDRILEKRFSEDKKGLTWDKATLYTSLY